MSWLTDKLEKLRRLIRARHARVITRIAGMETLTSEERDALREIPLEQLDVGERTVVQEAYRFGRVLHDQPEATADESAYEQAAAHPSMTAAEESTLALVQARVAQSIRTFAAPIENVVTKMVMNAFSQARGELDPSAHETIATTAATLREASGDWVRDWDRVAATELHASRQAGYADNVRRHHGDDAEVFKRPMPDACSYCLELHMGPDGHPRIFKLSELEANGIDNTGRKKIEWLAVVGPTHPYCSCELIHMPTGWGFTPDGRIMPNGTGGIRYTAKSFVASLTVERTLRAKGIDPSALVKSVKKSDRPVDFIDYQGLRIGIENPAGSTRSGVDADGHPWTTHMIYAYGYVEGTRGADGDSYDVFVGPHAYAPFVFVVHQARPDTGEAYDEDKAMLGFDDANRAKAAYLAHYDNPEFFGSMSMMTIDEFKEKVRATTDGMVKKLEASNVTSHLGDRAVVTGTSGPNIVWGSPTPPESAYVDPTVMRDVLEDRVEHMDEQPQFRLDRRVYNFRDFDNTPVHPLPYEQLSAVALLYEPSDAEIADHRQALQQRLDTRAAASEIDPKLLPRPPRLVLKEMP